MPFQRPAVKTYLRREILRTLKEDVSFVVVEGDTGKPISPAAIKLQKTSARKNRSNELSNQFAEYPGLILSSPRTTNLPPSEGDNARDLWVYRWVVQLIDRDGWDQENRLASWERWIEQVVSQLNFNPLCNAIPAGVAFNIVTNCTIVDDIDERQWLKDSEFVSGVLIEVRAQQTRAWQA